MPLQYFNDMDNLYEHACEIESAIELAVMDEQFEEAAKLKKEYDELRKKDLVDTMLTVSPHADTSFPQLAMFLEDGSNRRTSALSS